MTRVAAAPSLTPAEPSSGGRGVAALKIACGVGLLGVLAWQAARADGFERLIAGEKDYGLLGLALATLVGSVVLSFLRWRLVARGAGIGLGVVEALRVGAIGFAANFVALGNIGGDLVKAAMVARSRPGRRALAVTTVLVDRLMGLFALLVFASSAILLTGAATDADASPAVRLLCGATLTVTAIAAACFGLAIAPGRPLQRIVETLIGVWPLRRLTAAQRLGEKVVEISDAYRSGRASLAAALAVGIVCDAAFVASFFLTAAALPMAAPDFASHFLVVPLGLIAGAIPISPSGLGTVESTVEVLYRSLDDGVQPGDGALVAFGHRLLMLTVGAVAVTYYFASRASISDESRPE